MEIIRKAESKDLSCILKLYHQLLPQEDEKETEGRKRAFAQIIQDSNHVLMVVENDKGIVATAHLIIILNLSRGGKPSAYVENVVVDEKCRGQQIGERLFHAIFEYAEAQNCYKIFLCTGTINNAFLEQTQERRQAFYEKVGFQGGIKKGFIHYFDETI